MGYFGNMYFVMSRKKSAPRLEGDKNSQAYWEQVLKNEGLGMDAGRDPGHRKLKFIGNAADLDALNEQLTGQVGRVTPNGAGPD